MKTRIEPNPSSLAVNENPFRRVKLEQGTYAVICLGRPTRDEDLPPGFDHDSDEGRNATLATRSGFLNREDALNYTKTINPAWRPMIAKLETPV